MKKSDEKKGTKNGKPAARRLLLNKETIRNLLTADQLKAVHGGEGNEGGGDGDGNSSRNNHHSQ